MTDPPRLAVWLLRLVLPPDRYETIAGDLEEMFRLDVLPHAGPRVRAPLVLAAVDQHRVGAAAVTSGPAAAHASTPR